MAFVDLPARAGCVSATIDSKVFIWGGVLSAIEDTSHLKNLYVLDTLRETWKSCPITGEHPLGYKYCSTTQSGNTLYVYGGSDEYNHKTGSLFSLELDLDLALWKELSPHVHNGPRNKAGSGMVVYRDKIIIFRGYTEDEADTNELHVFDLSTGNNCK